MSVILNNNSIMSLYEANKRAGYDRNEGFLLNLQKKHQALDVLPFLPASDGSFHKYNRAVKLGSGAWREVNEGRTATRATMESVTTPVQLFSAESNVSDDVLKLADSPADVRDSENLMVATGLVNDFMDAFINSDGTDPLKMSGLKSLRGSIGTYCLNAKASGTAAKYTDIFVAELGEYGLNIRYNPKMTGGADGIGLAINDEGAVWMNDDNSPAKHMKVWKTTYDLTAGLELRRDEALVRIANVDVADTFNWSLFIDALESLPNSGDNAVAFVPRSIYGQVRKYAFTSSVASNFTVDFFEGFGQVIRCMGVPLLREDAIGTYTSKVN